MTNKIFYFFISIALFSCNLVEDKSKGIIVNEDIPEQISNRLIELGLINQSDTVLGVEYNISNEPNSILEMHTFFTKTKLLSYFQFGDKEPRIFEAPFSKTLSITSEMDSVLNRTEINTIILDTILFYKPEQRDHIYYDHNNFFCHPRSSFLKQKEFCQLLMETWRSNVEYPSLREIYDKYFDENGERKVTHDKVFERKKLQSLKNRLKKFSIDIIDKEDYLAMIYEGSIIYIRYSFYRKEFKVVKLVVDPLPPDEPEVVGIINTYVLNKHEEKVFPYTERGINYRDAHLSKENSENDIIDKYFK